MEFKLPLSNVLTRCTIGTGLQEIFNWSRKALAPPTLYYIPLRAPFTMIFTYSLNQRFIYRGQWQVERSRGDEWTTEMRGAKGGASSKEQPYEAEGAAAARRVTYL